MDTAERQNALIVSKDHFNHWRWPIAAIEPNASLIQHIFFLTQRLPADWTVLYLHSFNYTNQISACRPHNRHPLHFFQLSQYLPVSLASTHSREWPGAGLVWAYPYPLDMISRMRSIYSQSSISAPLPAETWIQMQSKCSWLIYATKDSLSMWVSESSLKP